MSHLYMVTLNRISPRLYDILVYPVGPEPLRNLVLLAREYLISTIHFLIYLHPISFLDKLGNLWKGRALREIYAGFYL